MLLLSNSLRFRTSWCGCPLQAGTKIIGYLSLVCNLIGGLICIAQWKLLKFDDKTDLDLLYQCVCIGTAILSMVVALSAGLLLGGAYNTRRWLLAPWLISDTLLRCVHICSLAHSVCTIIEIENTYGGKSTISWKALFSTGGKHSNWAIFGTFQESLFIFFAVAASIGIVFGFYLWWIVLSYFLELTDWERIVRGRKLELVESGASAVTQVRIEMNAPYTM